MKTMITRISVILIFFVIGFAIIYWTQPQYEMIREPAAVRQTYDFSHLRGTALNDAIKDRIVVGMQLLKENDRVGISFGHFAFTNAAGEKTLGCREYSKVRMSFEAEGVVVGGERPTMDVEGPCEFSEDLTKVNPLYLPMQRILAEKPADGEFEFRDGQPLTVRFANLSDEWPRKWNLVGISFHGQKSDVSVDRFEIRRALGSPVMISFSDK